MSFKYGKTPIGQLLFDLAFTKTTDKWLARKHKLPLRSIRDLRNAKSIKKLAAQVARDTQ